MTPPQSSTTQFKAAVVQMLRDNGGLPNGMEVLDRKPKDIESEIEAQLSTLGVTAWVMPIRPLQALQGVEFVFWEKAELRIRIIENVVQNRTGVDVYDLVSVVARALQWQNPATILSHPLQLAPNSTDFAEGVDKAGNLCVQMDVIFHAAFEELQSPG